MAEKKGEKRSEVPSMLEQRRKLLKAGLGSLLCAGAVETIYPLWRYVSPWQVEEAKPIELPKEKLPPGAVVEAHYGPHKVLIFHRAEGIVALSLTCTHLGCNVKWDPAKQEFHCPCHDARFDKDGKVLAGPPPAPLERLKVKEEEDKYIIGGD